MPAYHHYVPILKGKQGEYRALARLSEKDRLKMTPLIDVPFLPWDHRNKRPKKSYEQYLASVEVQIERSWGVNRRIMVDLYYVEEGATIGDGRHPLTFFFDNARMRNLHVIPATGLDRAVDYQDAVAKAISVDCRGFCLRLTSEDLEDLERLRADLANLLSRLNASGESVDLILDFRDLQIEDTSNTVQMAVEAVRQLPNIQQWRTLTLAASGFPRDLSGMRPATVERFPRTELILWEGVMSQGNLPRVPFFGDYGITHPDLLDIDPRTMRMSANLRYTLEGEWIVFKGRGVRREGRSQFKQLCRDLIHRREYKGSDFSWGDEYIALCAADAAGPGNATTWREIGTSHHLALVSRHVSNSAEL